MKHKTLLAAYRASLNNTYTEEKRIVNAMNYLLRDTDVILKRGKYKGRRAQIQDYYFDHGKEYLHVFIYRLDNRAGFKGREKFIEDHHREFLEFEDCELV